MLNFAFDDPNSLSIGGWQPSGVAAPAISFLWIAGGAGRARGSASPRPARKKAMAVFRVGCGAGARRGAGLTGIQRDHCKSTGRWACCRRRQCGILPVDLRAQRRQIGVGVSCVKMK